MLVTSDRILKIKHWDDFKKSLDELITQTKNKLNITYNILIDLKKKRY